MVLIMWEIIITGEKIAKVKKKFINNALFKLELYGLIMHLTLHSFQQDFHIFMGFLHTAEITSTKGNFSFFIVKKAQVLGWFLLNLCLVCTLLFYVDNLVSMCVILDSVTNHRLI